MSQPILETESFENGAPVVFDLERRMMISETSRKSTYHVLAPQGIGLTYPKERVVPFLAIFVSNTKKALHINNVRAS